ncbi:hypothetical protein ACFWP7_18180 [Streptomyces sp. NPDC058470]|uniref:hypothetical protein n=1 Tax=Streptomyces sp. NPDC058470 TaxID=3346515 RepID=UPI003646AA1A
MTTSATGLAALGADVAGGGLARFFLLVRCDEVVGEGDERGAGQMRQTVAAHLVDLLPSPVP